jgi:hypothetical protein
VSAEGLEQDDKAGYARLIVAFADISKSNSEMAAALSKATSEAGAANRKNASLQTLIGVLVAMNVLFVYWVGPTVRDLYDSHNATVQHASEALVMAQQVEKQLDDFRAKQIELNKQVASAIEELLK